MHRKIRLTLGVGAIVVVLGIEHIPNLGLFPEYFDLAWDEEVELHDGTIVMMHVARTFERRNHRLERWSGTQRKTSFSFDAGPPLGTVVQELERGDVFLLDRDNGVWYVGMWGEAGNPIQNVSEDARDVHVYTIVERSSASRLASNKDIPAVFRSENILPVTPGPAGMKHLDGTVVSINKKTAHWSSFPRAAGDPFPLIRRFDYGKGAKK